MNSRSGMTHRPVPARNGVSLRGAILLAAVLLLGGCATFSKDGGFEAVQTIAKERLGRDAKWLRSVTDEDSARAHVKSLLSRPLSADDAVQLALLNNRGLQAAYAELGIAEEIGRAHV